MSVRPSVEEICRQAEEHAEHLSKADTQSSSSWPDTLNNLSMAVSHLVRMTVPLYRAFNNGGLPAKRAGRALKIKALGVEFSVPLEQAGTWLRFAVLVVLLLNLTGYKIDIKGILQKQVTDQQALVAVGENE